MWDQRGHHKSSFPSGQKVQLSRTSAQRNAASGLYEVTRQLPVDEGECRYRIKSIREQHERVVKESDLQRV